MIIIIIQRARLIMPNCIPKSCDYYVTAWPRPTSDASGSIYHGARMAALACHRKIGPGNNGPRTKIFAENIGPPDQFRENNCPP